MVTVEEEEHVDAFANFMPPIVETKAVAAPTPVAAAPTPVAAAPTPVAPPAPVASPVAAPVTTPVAAAAAVVTDGPVWGGNVSTTSPLARTLAVQQTNYVELYGTTGQAPIGTE